MPAILKGYIDEIFVINTLRASALDYGPSGIELKRILLYAVPYVSEVRSSLEVITDRRSITFFETYPMSLLRKFLKFLLPHPRTNSGKGQEKVEDASTNVVLVANTKVGEEHARPPEGF